MLIVVFENYHFMYLLPLRVINLKSVATAALNVQLLLQNKSLSSVALKCRGPSTDGAFPDVIFAHSQSTRAVSLGSQLTAAKLIDGPDSQS